MTQPLGVNLTVRHNLEERFPSHQYFDCAVLSRISEHYGRVQLVQLTRPPIREGKLAVSEQLVLRWTGNGDRMRVLGVATCPVRPRVRTSRRRSCRAGQPRRKEAAERIKDRTPTHTVPELVRAGEGEVVSQKLVAPKDQEPVRGIETSSSLAKDSGANSRGQFA